MKLQYHWVLLFLIAILLFPASTQERALAVNGCDIEITRTSPSRLPQATKPGEIIVKFWFDVATSDPQNTQLSVEASGSNIDVLSKTISMSTKSGSVRIYVHTRAGGRASLTIRVACRVGGATDTDSKDMGSSYIVYIPNSWSPSIDPRTISKRDEVTLEVDGLDDIDDGVGELSVTAKLGSSTYRLRRVSIGVYKLRTNVNFVNSPSGTREIAFTVTKSYSGVTAVSRKDSTLRVLGNPPSVSFTPPSQVHRGEVLRVVVSEDDGDSLTGTLSAFGRDYTLERGENRIEVPRDINAGQYVVRATVEDVDGSNSNSWTLEVVNIPPHVEISLDRSVAVPGDTVSVRVTAGDDSPGADVKLIVTGKGIREEFEMDEGGGTLRFKIPEGYSGKLTFTANVIDRDGASSSSAKSITVGIPPKISGEIPSIVHRGEQYTLYVQGDDVSGHLDFMGEMISISGAGTYKVVVPRDARAGNYIVSIRVTSPFGEDSKKWSVSLENRPPLARIGIDRREASPGETVIIRASYYDDAPGLRATLYIGERAIQLPESSSVKTIRFTVPRGESSIEITLEAVDMDGAVTKDSVVLVVREGDHGGSIGGGNGGSSDSGRESGTSSNFTVDSGGPSNQSSIGPKDNESGLGVQEGDRVSSQLGTDEKISEVKTGASNTTGHQGTFSVTVVPSNPTIEDNVSVTAVPHGTKGSVWVVDPEGRTIREITVKDRTAFSFTVSRGGIWSVRWAYRVGGKTVFGHMELNVTPLDRTIELNETDKDEGLSFKENPSNPSINGYKGEAGEIKPFKPSCQVIRGERPRSWDVEVIIAIMAVSLIGMLVVRRRIP